MGEKILYEIFIPEKEYLVINVESKNPAIAIKNIVRYYRKYFEVKGSGVWEKETRYDNTDGSFFVRINVSPLFPEKMVKIIFEHVFSGNVPLKEEQIGKITIKMRAYIRISFEAKSNLEKFFYMLYYYLFYQFHKNEIINEVKKVLENVKNDIIKDLTQ